MCLELLELRRKPFADPSMIHSLQLRNRLLVALGLPPEGRRSEFDQNKTKLRPHVVATARIVAGVAVQRGVTGGASEADARARRIRSAILVPPALRKPEVDENNVVLALVAKDEIRRFDVAMDITALVEFLDRSQQTDVEKAGLTEGEETSSSVSYLR
jgi:hypothetical protein